MGRTEYMYSEINSLIKYCILYVYMYVLYVRNSAQVCSCCTCHQELSTIEVKILSLTVCVHGNATSTAYMLSFTYCTIICCCGVDCGVLAASGLIASQTHRASVACKR